MQDSQVTPCARKNRLLWSVETSWNLNEGSLSIDAGRQVSKWLNIAQQCSSAPPGDARQNGLCSMETWQLWQSIPFRKGLYGVCVFLRIRPLLLDAAKLNWLTDNPYDRIRHCGEEQLWDACGSKCWPSKSRNEHTKGSDGLDLQENDKANSANKKTLNHTQSNCMLIRRSECTCSFLFRMAACYGLPSRFKREAITLHKQMPESWGECQTNPLAWDLHISDSASPVKFSDVLGMAYHGISAQD